MIISILIYKINSFYRYQAPCVLELLHFGIKAEYSLNLCVHFHYPATKLTLGLTVEKALALTAAPKLMARTEILFRRGRKALEDK